MSNYFVSTMAPMRNKFRIAVPKITIANPVPTMTNYPDFLRNACGN